MDLCCQNKVEGQSCNTIFAKDLNLFFTVPQFRANMDKQTWNLLPEQKTPVEYLIMQSSTACPA